MPKPLGRKPYEARLRPLQLLVRSIALSYFVQGRSGVIVVEGTDTAGKGGAIRRLTAELDPRFYRFWPIGPPNAEEARHHYLWRFWRKLPAAGSIAIFDRSWYGRVMVERVDRLTPEARWRAAYGEINAFEAMLDDDGTRLVKLYLDIGREEQRRRLLERAEDPFKHWKISAADLRSHHKWEDYAEAASEMFARTSTENAPWHLIAADDKRGTRIEVLETVIAALGAGVDLTPPPLDPETASLVDALLR